MVEETFRGAGIGKSSTIIVGGAWTPYVSQITEFDSDGYEDGGWNDLKVPPDLDGYYLCIGVQSLGVAGVNFYIGVREVLAAGAVVQHEAISALNTPVVAACTYRVQLRAAGDQLVGEAIQVSGGPNRALSNALPNSFKQMARLGT